MRYLGRIVILAVTVVILTLSLALAGSKFPNKDTAKDRQDTTMGTKPRQEEVPPIIIEQKKNEDTNIQTQRPEQEEKDWYDSVIISVEPQVETE